jgi:hypothetical protein
MSKKQVATTKTTKATEPTTTTPEPSAPPPADIVKRLREASSPDDAIRLLSPDAKPKAKVDTVYEVIDPMPKPLPQKRGLSVLVYVTAARLNAAFRIAEIEAALPDKKSVKYWVRALAKSGHFREQAAN